MRLRLATKFSATILGVVALSVLSSLVALYAAWRTNRRLEKTNQETTASVRVEEVQIALLQRNTLLAAYLLDKGNHDPQDRLQELQRQFQAWIARVRTTTAVPAEEETLLQQLEQAWAQLDACQDEALALYKRGEKDRATALLLTDINGRRGAGRLSQQAYTICNQLIADSDRNHKAALARADVRIRVATWTVGGAVALTLALAGGLVWLFFYRVIFPLRGMMADARLFRGDPWDAGTHAAAEDELHAMQSHLRDLMSDVTDTRSRLDRSRTRLLAAEKLASVGRLAATVAHEIRNPLTAMKMWLFSLQEAVHGNAELVHKLDIVSEEISRLEGIIRNFLEFSRPLNLACRPLPVGSVIGQTLELLAPRFEEAQICVAAPLPARLPAVTADPDKLKQVLLNLLGNAADAMAQGGEIRITGTAENDADGRAMVVVRVCDSGPGMPADVQSRIFEPFFTTKDDGTGLGLCISAQIMARHGGSLILESSTEKGTTFAVWIPRAPEGAHGQDSRS